jgi:hypothetical protein
LPQGNIERRLQRVIEHRIAGAVGEISENDRVFLCQAIALLMRPIVKTACDKPSEEEGEHRSLPELRNPSRWHGHHPRTRDRNSPRFCIPLQPLQIRSYIGCVLVAKIAVLLQCLVDDVLCLGR